MGDKFLRNNSVGRLYTLLDEVKKMGVPANTKMREVWARVFGIEPNDAEELFLLYVEILRLLKNAREDMERLPNIEPSLYLQPFQQLERAFTVSSFEHPVEHFKRFLDDATMTGLKFGAYALSQASQETIVEQEVLDNLQSEIESLIQDILQSEEIIHELRSFLIDRLDDIRRAIMYYRLNGSRGLRKALETTIGASFLLQFSQVPNADKDSQDRWENMKQRFGKVIAKIAEITLSVTVKSALEGTILPMLPGK